MRTIQRNKRTIYYALYQGVTEITDEYGYYTGEVEITYGNPVKAKMNVSGGRGAADIEMFGIDNPYIPPLPRPACFSCAKLGARSTLP